MSINQNQYAQTADEVGRAEFADVVVAERGTVSAVATAANDSTTLDVRIIPAWVSVLPAVVAIAIALALRNVIPALLL